MKALDIFAAARSYLRQGWSVVPLPRGKKAPKIAGWPDLRLAENELANHFGDGGNVGVLLGEPSGGLVDIDLDAPEVLGLATAFLPATGAVFGRASKPRSHSLYIVEHPATTSKFQDPMRPRDTAMIVELRSTGAQTIFPGSTHPEGEAIEWDEEGEPAHVDATDLLRAVRCLAAAALLVRYYPNDGSRHDFALALSGALTRAGWTAEQFGNFLGPVAEAAGDAETRDRIRAGEYSAARIQAGRPATGWPRVEKLLGRDVVRCLREWLEFSEIEHASTAPTSSAQKRGKSQATLLVDLAEGVLASGDLVLWHTPGAQPFATLTVADHRENWGLRSTVFRSWLFRQFFLATHSTPNPQAVQSALGMLTGRALFDGEEHEAFVRVAEHAGLIYIDLGDSGWHGIEIGPTGWSVVDNPPVRFRRARGVLSLPEPTKGGSIHDVFEFLNIDDSDYQILFLSCLATAFNPRGPYPILAFHGVQGCGKSTAATLFRKLTDPNEAPLRTPPRDERDLIIAATNAFVVALDNLSSIPQWLSDALCRLSTGGGFSTRELFSDSEETLFNTCRPVLLNGLEELAAQGDLLDRMVILRLAPIKETSRRDEKTFWRKFEALHPRLFGAVLDAVHTAFINSSKVQLSALPRMADFAIWATAAEGAFGVAPGTFMGAYHRNRGETNQIALESSQVALAILALLDQQPPGIWEGTAGKLLDALTPFVAESVQRSKFWPRTGQGMGRALDRITANLGAAGVSVWRLPRGRERVIRIAKGTHRNVGNVEPSLDAHQDDIHDVSDVFSPSSSVHEGDAREGRSPEPADNWYRPEPLPSGGWRCECGAIITSVIEWSKHTGVGGCPLKVRI